MGKWSAIPAVLVFFAAPLWAGASRDFELDDAGDSLTAGDVLDLTAAVTTFSACAWFKRESNTAAWHVFFDKRTSSSDGYVFAYDDINDRLTVRVGPSTWYACETTPCLTSTLSAWEWLCVTVDRAGDSVCGSINAVADPGGCRVATGLDDSDLSNVGSLRVGARSWDAGANFADGQMAYLHVYHNKILTAAEIETLMWCPGAIRGGLVGYWPMRDSSDQADHAAGNTATNSGTVESFDGPPVMECGGPH